MRNKKNKTLIMLYLCLYTLSILISIANSVLYPDIFYKYFNFSPLWIYLLFFLFSYYGHYKNLLNKANTKLHKFAFVLTIISAVLYTLFNMIESLTYTNYVFSKFHIHPAQLSFVFYIFLVEYVIGINFNDAKNRIRSGAVKLFRIETLIIPLVIFVFINNVVGITNKMKDDIFYMSTNVFGTVKEKYEFKLGSKFYNFTEFVKNNTDNNSKILIPPFPAYPWPQSGNSVYMRYFLYPRVLVSGEEYSPGIDTNQFDYVLIAWGETTSTSGNYTHGWPKFDVPTEYIMLLSEDGTTSKLFVNYDNIKFMDKEYWGLIKIKKTK